MNLHDALVKRRTSKVMLDPNYAEIGSPQDNGKLEFILQAAGNAPFHCGCLSHHREGLSSPVPWRAYMFSTSDCHRLMQNLIDMGDATKVPNMLAAATNLVIVTWLPDEDLPVELVADKQSPLFNGSLRNMEHIAAASAFAQSVLLAATAEGYETYWSSGGALRGREVYEQCGISKSEVFLGGLFLFRDVDARAEKKSGSMVNERGDLSDWSKWVTL